ncbi:MAG: hypothetical protein AAGJ70_04310 [Pseudomonadota bacterium]
MDDNPFFRTVWRFNALAFAVGVSLVTALAAYALYGTVKRHVAPRVTNVASAPSEQRPQALSPSTIRFGGLRDLHVGRTVWAPIVTQETYRSGIAAKATSSNRNYVVVELATGRAVQVFEDNAGLIIEARAVFGERDRRQPPRALVFSVATEDTNNDGRLSRNDALGITIARADGSGATRLNVRGALLAVHAAPDEEVALFVRDQTSGAVEMLHVTAENFAITQRDTIWRRPADGGSSQE